MLHLAGSNVWLRGLDHQQRFGERIDARGGGGKLVLFMVRGRAIFRGTFLKPLRNYG